MKRFQSKKVCKTVFAVLFSFWLIGSCFSMIKFQCIEPITTAIGVSRVLFLKENLVTLQPFPKRIMMAPQNGLYNEIETLNQELKSSGYEYLEGAQMGASHTFINREENKKISAIQRSNAYYCLWVFNTPHESK